ncbi:hypothetical protein BGZ46_009758 [Entomortierella lignicola]|nr:hypothetical protein BGZ46_009758 [Entomortierella lignicola]
MIVVNAVELEISIEALKKLDVEMKTNKQEKRFYDYLFQEGNTVSLYISGCSALVLANISIKKYTTNVWSELHDLVAQQKTESEHIKVDYVNDQDGFRAETWMCLYLCCKD